MSEYSWSTKKELQYLSSRTPRDITEAQRWGMQGTTMKYFWNGYVRGLEARVDETIDKEKIRQYLRTRGVLC